MWEFSLWLKIFSEFFSLSDLNRQMHGNLMVEDTFGMKNHLHNFDIIIVKNLRLVSLNDGWSPYTWRDSRQLRCALSPARRKRAAAAPRAWGQTQTPTSRRWA